MDERVSRDVIEDRQETRPRRVRTRRRWLRVATAVAVAALVVFGLYYVLRPSSTPATGSASRRGGAGGALPPQPVGAAVIGRGDIRMMLNALGTVTPLATVTVRTQISGQLTQVAFTEGQIVQKGDFLAQIDPRPYQVALLQAQGALARDQALLHNAQLDLTRYKTLVAQDSLSRQQLDTQAALVQQYAGTIQADQAGIDSAKLNLVYCHITAPISGRVGLRQVDAGNYVQTGDANGIVVITEIQPISVIFALPEDNLPEIARQPNGGAGLPVAAFDRADLHQIASGQLATIDNQVDTTTGTVKFRATFDNADRALFPNQFVNAQLLVETLHGVVVAPATAIQRGEPGTFAYVVRADDTVHVQPVKLGPQDGANVEIVSGLAEGDRVVTDGADRLREGATVTVPQPGSAQGGAPGAPASEDGSGHRRGHRGGQKGQQ
jgi:multidrug efflux system membrane fusion protein